MEGADLMAEIDTHNLRIDFGKHRGELWTRLPVSYLKWIVNVSARNADIAEAELKRRGTHTPDLDVSGHAIDRASLACAEIWRETRAEDEGLHAWLCRVAQEALDKGVVDHKDRHLHLGIAFAFDMEVAWPVLKTVMLIKG